MRVEVFLEGLLAGSITDVNHVRKLIYYFATILGDEFIKFFLFSDALLVVGRPESF